VDDLLLRRLLALEDRDRAAEAQHRDPGRDLEDVVQVVRDQNDREMRSRAREVLDSLKVKVPSINVSVKGMSGGQRQCLAIARALLWGRQIVILDEPTAALGVRESRRVLDLILRLRSESRAVIVVSHAMDHVMEIADRAVVLRRGRKVGELVPSSETYREIVSLIVGGGE